MQLSQILPYAQILVSVLLITVILLQQGQAAMGSSMGQGDFNTTRRGPQKHLFTATIVLAILFIGLAVLNLLA